MTSAAILGEKAYATIYYRGTIRLLSRLYSLIYARYDAKSLIGMKTEGVKP